MRTSNELLRKASWAPACLVVLLIGAQAGCVFKGARQIFLPRPAHPDIWHPQPVRIRVYPSSRFNTDSDSQTVVLEARIELLDDMDDAIKGVGQFHFELLGKPGRGRTALDRRLYSWDVAVFTLEQQTRRYDKVTRTYLFRLKVDEPFLPPRDTTLKAVFVPPTGHPLEDQTVIRGTAVDE